jgi:hypothetical protein
MCDREDLRNRGWTRAQINALPPDLVIQPSETNHLIESRRLWDRRSYWLRGLPATPGRWTHPSKGHVMLTALLRCHERNGPFA